MDSVDLAFAALEGNWLEFAFEMVPYLGDAYSAGKLAKVAPGVARQVDTIMGRFDLAIDAYKGRSGLRAAMSTPQGQQAHHLIPVDVLDSNVVQAALEAGFDFNGRGNGMNVLSQAGSHSRRTQRLRDELSSFARRNPDYSASDARNFLENMVRSERRDIIQNGNRVANQ